MSRCKPFFAVVLLSVALVRGAIAGVQDELTVEQWGQLQEGKPVVVTEDVDGAVWPRITVYLRSEATAEEAAAVFIDYDLTTQYIRNPEDGTGVVQSTPHWDSENPSSCTVDFVLTFPAILGITISPQRVLTQNTHRLYADGHYQAAWQSIRGSEAVRATEGQFRSFHAEEGAILVYSQMLYPSSKFFEIFTRKLISQTRQNVIWLNEQIISERRTNRELLERQVAFLRRVLE